MLLSYTCSLPQSREQRRSASALSLTVYSVLSDFDPRPSRPASNTATRGGPMWVDAAIYLLWVLFSIASIWVVGLWCWLTFRMTEPFPVLICRSRGRSKSRVAVAYLADHRELIPELAAWFRREWPEASEKFDPADRLSRFSVRDSIPMSLVALDRGRPIGTVSLLLESVHSHRHLSPWVGGLYVVPERRHQGVATQLISETLRVAGVAGRAYSLHRRQCRPRLL